MACRLWAGLFQGTLRFRRSFIATGSFLAAFAAFTPIRFDSQNTQNAVLGNMFNAVAMRQAQNSVWKMLATSVKPKITK